MTDLNSHLVSALGRLGIPVENYEHHSDFQALPARDGDPEWKGFQSDYSLNRYELGALKNARCGNPTQAGKF